MLSELAFPHIRCCLSATHSDLMKSTAVDESLSSMNQQFCSRENQLLQMDDAYHIIMEGAMVLFWKGTHGCEALRELTDKLCSRYDLCWYWCLHWCFFAMSSVNAQERHILVKVDNSQLLAGWQVQNPRSRYICNVPLCLHVDWLWLSIRPLVT